MTVAEFYARHAVDGRAVLSGTVADPLRWVVRLRGAGGVGYFMCAHDCSVAVRQVDPETAIADVTRARVTAATPVSRWDRAARRWSARRRSLLVH